MLPPRQLIALALCFAAALGRPASPSFESEHGDGRRSLQLLKDPYNPRDLVSSDIPGRPPRLPLSERPKGFPKDGVAWSRFQNVEHIMSRILTYDDDEVPSASRWTGCMYGMVSRQDLFDYLDERFSGAKVHAFVGKEEECIKKVNEDVKREASAKGQSTYPAGQNYDALDNLFHLESPKTPGGRRPRLPYKHRPTGFRGDEARYIAGENKKAIIFKLSKFDGQRTSSWLLFTQCLAARAGSTSAITSYLEEKLDPAEMQKMRDHESDCVDHVNRRVDADARRQQKQAYLPVRTYAPIDPRRLPGKQQEQEQQQQQQEQQRQWQRHEISTAPFANWAHQAGRFVRTRIRRFHLGALPLQKLVQEAHTKVPAWEAELAL
ncbi:MAG: hypothetical protein M1826_006382 [Phylliscum demangeonii]|nr:MAG: hypothetical protein M1826_006382 [Phylliscum demangeonii]